MELKAQGSDVPGMHTSVDNPRGMCGTSRGVDAAVSTGMRGRKVGKGRKVGDAQSSPSPLLLPAPPAASKAPQSMRDARHGYWGSHEGSLISFKHGSSGF